MKLYRVKVNGKVYEVELEAISETQNHIEKDEPKANASSSNGSSVVPSPIGGKIIDILVKVGDKVKKGDRLLIIEAMKLENDVTSPVDGTIIEIKVNKGATVNNADPLIIIG